MGRFCFSILETIVLSHSSACTLLYVSYMQLQWWMLLSNMGRVSDRHNLHTSNVSQEKSCPSLGTTDVSLRMKLFLLLSVKLMNSVQVI